MLPDPGSCRASSAQNSLGMGPEFMGLPTGTPCLLWWGLFVPAAVPWCCPLLWCWHWEWGEPLVAPRATSVPVPPSWGWDPHPCATHLEL